MAARESVCFEPYVRILQCARVTLSAGAWCYADLYAPFWRLYHNTSAGASVELNGRRIALLPKQLYIIPANTHFAAHNARLIDHFFLHFLVHPPWQARMPLYILPYRQTAAGLIAKISRLLKQSRDPRAALALPVYALLYHALSTLPTDEFCIAGIDPRMQRAAEIMETRFHEHLTNAQLARAVGLSVTPFIRIFHQTFKMPPKQYLRQKRVEQACLLLRFTDQSLEEIATATGFCDRYHLSRVFKEHYGTGPAAYRKIRS